MMNANLEVIVNGQVVPETDQRIYIRKGQEYQLRISNKGSKLPTDITNRRLVYNQRSRSLIATDAKAFLAVITVDGLSIMDGKPGDLKYSGGYVIEPEETVNIPGWRLDNNQVAKFLFSEIDKSYAHLIGKPTNVGVIGCAFFAEKEFINFIADEARRYGGEDGDIGTGFGRATEHKVTEVHFEREEKPFLIKVIYYFEENKPTNRLQQKNPFPGCQPPPGWHP